jgi:hypothetical protein
LATKTTVIIYDDLDGTPGASRVSFAYRGASYEIDLSEQHQAELGAALAPFIVAARKTGRGSGRADGRTATTRIGRGQNLTAVRAWAREQGLEVSDRGRVPIDVQKAYDEAH